MATTSGAHTTPRRKKAGFGLLANGSSGEWEIAIDESLSGTDRWFTQIEGPSAALYFEIDSVDIVGKMLQFLERRRNVSSNGTAEQSSALTLGKDKKAPITLVSDDEYDDRFFVLVGLTESPTVRIVVAGTDVVQILDALRQVKEDLDDQE